MKDLWEVHYLDLVDNLAEGIQRIKYKDDDSFLLIKYKCPFYKKYYFKNLDEELKKPCKNTFKSSYNYVNKFILLLKQVFIVTNVWMNI